MWKKIDTPAQAIDLLGGTAKVAAMFAKGEVDRGAVTMWRSRPHIPPKAWLVLGPRLRRIGHFSPKLFNMLEPGGHDGRG